MPLAKGFPQNPLSYRQGRSPFIYRGVIPGGLGGPQPPQLLAKNTFFGFSHTTDRKVPSEVVLMGSFMSSVILW